MYGQGKEANRTDDDDIIPPMVRSLGHCLFIEGRVVVLPRLGIQSCYGQRVALLGTACLSHTGSDGCSLHQFYTAI